MIYGEIYKLQTMHGWVYNGCSKCGTKPRIDDRGMMCSGCKKPPESIEPKYVIKVKRLNH